MHKQTINKRIHTFGVVRAIFDHVTLSRVTKYTLGVYIKYVTSSLASV